MRLEESKYEIIIPEPGLLGMKKMCELGGRICYRTEDKITDDSHVRLFKVFDDNDHMSPYGHGTVTLKMKVDDYLDFINELQAFPVLDENGEDLGYTIADHFRNPMWTRTKFVPCSPNEVLCDEDVYITTNYRVIKELKLDYLIDEYWCDPTEYHVPRYSVLIRADIGVTRELNRHASGLAINEESTRYCRYDKAKFNGEIAHIKPDDFCDAMEYGWEIADDAYFRQLEEGKTPQLARRNLTLGTATTALYTGFPDEWKHVFEKRCDVAAHPDVRKIMIPLEQEFKDRGYIK